MTELLQDQTVLVVGRGSGFARAIALTAHDAGARGRIEDLDRDKVRLSFDPKGEQCKADYFAVTSTFLTGQTLHVDGGEPLT